MPALSRRRAILRLGHLGLLGRLGLPDRYGLLGSAAVAARSALLGGAAVSGVLAPTPGLAMEGSATLLPRPTSWSALLAESEASGRVLVVLFSLKGCGFCEQVRRDHLRHLGRSRVSSVRVAELDMFDRSPFPEGSSPAELAASLGIRVAPTVAFFGAKGELSSRLVGYNSADFYGAYLDERIAEAIERIGQRSGG